MKPRTWCPRVTLLLLLLLMAVNLFADRELEQLKKKAKSGDPQAMFELGWSLIFGEGMPANKQEGIRLLDAAADKEVWMAQDFLFAWYSQGNKQIGIKQDHAKALKYARLLAAQGNPRYQFYLGESYYFGWGVAKDPAEAYFWYYLAASDEDPYNDRYREYAGEYVAELQTLFSKEELTSLNARAETALNDLAAAEAKRRAEAEEIARLKEHKHEEAELLVIPMEEREIIAEDHGLEIQICLKGLDGSSDTPLSISAKHYLRSRAEIIITDKTPVDAEYIWFDTDQLTRICLKRDGRIAFNYEDALQMSSQALKDRLVKLKKSTPRMIYWLAFEDEEQLEAMVDLVKLVKDTGIELLVVRKAGPDPVKPDPEFLLKYEQALQEIGEIRTNTLQTEKDDPPFIEVYYDDPPMPLATISPVYPEFAKRTRIQGTVVLEMEIRRDGTVRNVIVKRSVAGLDEAAIEAVKGVRFQPGKLDGQPVDTKIIIPIEFRLN